MPIAPPTDELARLRAALAAQQIRLARLERRRRLPRRFLPLAAVALRAALLPLSLLAATPVFSDLGNAAPVHQPNIQALAAAGITTGFADPNSTNPDVRLYDPKATVTREEMASFLARTAGLGENAPVANAKTAQTAANAATVGGLAPGGLVRVARAVQEERFEGTPSTSRPIAAIYPAFETALGLSIDAPGPGFLLVNATILGGAPTGATILVRLRDPQIAEPSPAQALNLSGGSNLIAGLPLTYVFPVAAGTHTILLEASRGESTPAAVTNGVLTALFVPFAQDGGTTLAP